MLYDTTLCIGCKTCVVACQEANDLEPDTGAEGLWQMPQDLNGQTKNIIKLYKEGDRLSYMKAQCMHCVDPACAAACMLAPLHKDEVTGVVELRPGLLRRLPLLPDGLPVQRAEVRVRQGAPRRSSSASSAATGSRAPRSTEKDGFTRYPKGHGPACCEVCPREAVIYGTRDELLAEAKRRIAEKPGKYFEDRVYGEIEGGGTQVLYLSHVPFEKLGLPELGDRRACPGPPTRSRRGSTRASSPRSRSTPCSPP